MNKIFYILKPLIPRNLQIFLRRILVNYQKKKYNDVWPILQSAASKPKEWRGWPDGKKFAFIITHDVELQKGHNRCKKLMQIEKSLGFKSSYNFVPERYEVSTELRNYLSENGFEVGVHGLNHDGKLFRSKEIFSNRAKKINKYLKEWGAIGFRAPAMHHNLEWIKLLNVDYDLSTFDTDPFEPQSDGVGTIFPFIVNDEKSNRRYVEFPYTIVQDFTLFITMREKNIDIWKRKIDWIVKNEGMVLVNIHPDYVNFENQHLMEEFPVQYVIDLLNYVKMKYEDQYWNPLPKDAAKHVLAK